MRNPAEALEEQTSGPFRLRSGRFGTRAQWLAEIAAQEQQQHRLSTMADTDKLLKVQLPAWQDDDPAFWFQLADGMFELLSPPPTDKQKATIAGTKIPMEVLKKHKKALAQAEPYKALKEALGGPKSGPTRPSSETSWGRS